MEDKKAVMRKLNGSIREFLNGLTQIAEICHGKHKIELLYLVRMYPGSVVTELIRKIYDDREKALKTSPQYYKHMRTLVRNGMVAGNRKYIITERGNKLLTMLETVAGTPPKEPIVKLNYEW